MDLYLSCDIEYTLFKGCNLPSVLNSYEQVESLGRKRGCRYPLKGLRKNSEGYYRGKWGKGKFICEESLVKDFWGRSEHWCLEIEEIG
ncbi:unnamed protein product [Moneuplotes crassus]|uniref:Uncharacterized protein n=1 Tax=Euplotes crassus TaxID=5936 RepID=A0AAD1XTQ4_EUPCR|nr:unnamed protein product [Moneuplotes crassus]